MPDEYHWPETDGDWDDRAHARHTDPWTSHQAAALTDCTKWDREVLSILTAYHPRPLASIEMAELSGLSRVCLSPRLRPLARKGLIEQTGAVRIKGRHHLTWTLKRRPMVVRGQGPQPATLMVIGEQPGEWEVLYGIPFHPRAAVGRELTHYLRRILRLEREDVFLTNLCLEHLDGRALSSVDVHRWEPELRADIRKAQPQVIMTLGREATRWFLGDVDMEQVYALPHRYEHDWGFPPITIVPNYLRLYDSDLQPLVWYGFEQCRRVLQGEIGCHAIESRSRFDYGLVRSAQEAGYIHWATEVAVDTEGLPGKPWGLSYAHTIRSARVIRAANYEALGSFSSVLVRQRVILHNALHDLAVLRDMRITVPSFDDTMVMAALLCLEPQALKALAYRYRGIQRQSYDEVIGPASRSLALDWLHKASYIDWGPAEEEVVFEGDQVKIRKPWSLNRRIDGIIGTYTGEIVAVGPRDRKSRTKAKRKLEAIGVRVGKLNPLGDGWIDCRVGGVAWIALQPLADLGEYVLILARADEAADNPRQRWATIAAEMPEAADRVEQSLGLMPEAGLDAVEEVFGPQGLQTAVEYSAGDADDTLSIYPILRDRIRALDLTRAYELDLAVIPMIDRMMRIGFMADKAYFQKLGVELAAEMERDLNAIQSAVGHRINPNSSLQVGALLFEKLRLPVQSRTATGRPSTADEVIEALRLLSDHPVLPLISDYRELSKMKTTYTDRLWRWLGPDSRIRTTLRLTRVPSGRLASSEPNLMAIPVRSQRLLNGVKLGKAIRDGFIPRPGCVLYSVDLDQIEMRVLAHRSQDPSLLGVFERKEDIHQKTASLIFSLPMGEVAKGSWQRESAKNCGFGIVYGITAAGLQLQLKLRGIDRTEAECQAMIDAYLVTAYPGVRALMEDKKAEARRYGYVRTMYGRIRYLPGIHSPNGRLRAEAERISLNHDIQGTAQEVEKEGMRTIWEAVLPAVHAEGWYAEPILQVHDELIFEVDDGIIDVFDTLVRHTMQEAVRLSIPLGAKGTYGPTWGALK